ncbi:MAG: hypothetical protein ACI8RD_005955 [Bacillariaceae sp.]|jgi:hypothetical protein
MAESQRNMMRRLANAGVLLLLVSLFSLFNNSFVHGDNKVHNRAPYTEEERMAEYVRQGYKFPFDIYVSFTFILLYCTGIDTPLFCVRRRRTNLNNNFI